MAKANFRDKLGGIKGGFVPVPYEVLNSPAFCALSYTARSLLFDFYAKVRGSNNGNLSAALSDLKHRGWCSPTTLAKSLKELEAAGFIRVTRNTIGVKNGSKLCKLYRLTDRDSYGFIQHEVEGVKVSREYIAFKSLKEVKSAIKEQGKK